MYHFNVNAPVHININVYVHIIINIAWFSKKYFIYERVPHSTTRIGCASSPGLHHSVLWRLANTSSAVHVQIEKKAWWLAFAAIADVKGMVKRPATGELITQNALKLFVKGACWVTMAATLIWVSCLLEFSLKPLYFSLTLRPLSLSFVPTLFYFMGNCFELC